MKKSQSVDNNPVTRREPNDDEIPWVDDFHDQHFEPRRLFGEFLGTFLIVLASIGAIVVNVRIPGSIPIAAQVVAPGLVLMAVIYTIGGVSGAHVNPAVTISYALRRNFPWRRVPGYVVAQVAGGVAAVAFLRSTIGDVGRLGASAPSYGFSDRSAVLIELVLTLGLVTVTLGTASGANNVGPNAAIARGGYVVAAGLWAGPLTGAIMNPARSLSSAIVANDWAHLWIYIVGPLAGGALAVGFAWILRGPPTVAADRSSQGFPT
jgi:aquaporin Z